MIATMTKLLTAEEFALLPEPADGSLLELERGRLVVMARPKPRHGVCCTKVIVKLSAFVDAHRLGWVLSNDTGVRVERDPDTVRGPDVCFYTFAQMPEVPETYAEDAPALAVEVLSPDDRAGDVRRKVAEYLAAGVRLVWVVDPDARAVMVYRPGERGAEFAGADALDGHDVLPGFRCPVADLFS